MHFNFLSGKEERKRKEKKINNQSWECIYMKETFKQLFTEKIKKFGTHLEKATLF